MNEIIKPSEDSYKSDQFDIEIFNLKKIYPLKRKTEKKIALNNINLKIRKGEIFGLLGPNGAGKTTMVSILTTLIEPTSGYANVLGYNILKKKNIIKKNIGLMLGSEMIYYRMTGYNNLKYFAKLYGVEDYKSKIRELADLMGLTNWIDHYVEKYSSGMKTKLAIARVLITDPKILFLDEPMLGLDPLTVKSIINILNQLDKTIFLTSHQMNVVQKLCDRIAFIRDGKIINVNTQDNFKKLLMNKKTYIEVTLRNDLDRLLNNLKSLEYINDIKIYKKKNISFSIQDESNLPDLFNILKSYPIIHFKEKEMNLEDIFVEYST